MRLPAVLRFGAERRRAVRRLRRRGAGIWLETVFLTLVLGLALTLDLSRLGAHSLLGDEAIYASPAREAAVHGHWYPLRWGDGHIFINKPPLVVWPVALSFYLAGVGERTDRLPSAIAGAALAGVVYLFGSRLLGPWTGLLAAALLATCRPWLFRHGAREGVGEPLFCLLLTVALLLYLRYRSTGRHAWLGGACAAAALAALVKGVFSPAILGAVTAVWEILQQRLPVTAGPPAEITGARVEAGPGGRVEAGPGGERRGDDPPPPAAGVRERRWRKLAARLGAPAALTGVGMAAYFLWLLDSGRRGAAIAAFLHRDIFVRATEGLDWRHVHGAGFYPEVLGKAFGHWWPAVIPAAVWLWRCRRQDGPRARASLLVAVWPVVVVAILSASVSKLAWYLDSALPPLAILLAAGCGEIGRLLARRRVAPLGFALLLAVLVGLRARLAWQTLEQPMQLGQMHRFVLAFRQLPGARLYLELGNRADGRLQPWDAFYLAELDSVSRPLPPGLRAVPACTLVIAGRPTEVDARLHAERWYAAPIESRSPEETPLSIIDLCGGRLGRDLG